MPSEQEIIARDLAVLKGTAGHDLREALNVIHLYAQVLTADEKNKAIGGPIVEGSRRLRGMIDGVVQLLDLGPPEKGPARMGTAITRLGSEVQLQVVDGTAEVELPMGARHLDLVLAALVDNAVRHGAAPVRVSATTTSLTVEDAGDGMSEKDRKYAFRLFHRGATASQQPGVGLALVDRVVFRYGGHVQLGPSELGGLAVTVDLRPRD